MNSQREIANLHLASILAAVCLPALGVFCVSLLWFLLCPHVPHSLNPRLPCCSPFLQVPPSPWLQSIFPFSWTRCRSLRKAPSVRHVKKEFSRGAYGMRLLAPTALAVRLSDCGRGPGDYCTFCKEDYAYRVYPQMRGLGGNHFARNASTS